MAEYGIDIGHWHRLTIDPETGAPRLSSRRLLTLLEHMSEDSEFKRIAQRGGQWPDWKKMLAEAANQQYRMLAWYAAAHSTAEHDYTFDPSEYEFVDPALQGLRAEQEARDAELAAQTDPELAKAGWA